MKTYANYLFVILMLAIISCDKEKRFEGNLDGTWELRLVKGGRIANAPSDYPAGNGSLVKFNGEMYQRWEKGTVVSSSKFVIVKQENEIDGTKFSFKVDFIDNKQMDLYAQIIGKRLMLSNGSMASDGVTLTYEKF